MFAALADEEDTPTTTTTSVQEYPTKREDKNVTTSSKLTMTPQQKAILTERKAKRDREKKEREDRRERESRCAFFDECASYREGNWPYCSKCYEERRGKCAFCHKETTLSMIPKIIHKYCADCRQRAKDMGLHAP